MLKCVRIRKRDRVIDPFRIDEAERLMDANCTKTGEDRIVTLCPRAIRVAARQLKLRDRLKAAGRILASPPLHRTPFIRELEPDARQESAMVE